MRRSSWALRLDFAVDRGAAGAGADGRAGQKLELAQGLRAERTPRELRLAVGAAAGAGQSEAGECGYGGSIPGEIVAPAFGVAAAH